MAVKRQLSYQSHALKIGNFHPCHFSNFQVQSHFTDALKFSMLLMNSLIVLERAVKSEIMINHSEYNSFHDPHPQWSCVYSLIVMVLTFSLCLCLNSPRDCFYIQLFFSQFIDPLSHGQPADHLRIT